ncbi:MAG: hypothetical protein ABFS38_14190 [Bacteroidota bacterium]
MRIRLLFLILLATILSVFTLSGHLLAHDPVETQSDSTRWIVELPVWVPGYRGEISWGDIDINGGGGDGGILGKIFDSATKLDYYYVGKVRYSYQKWRFQGDIYGGQIDNSVNFVLQDGSLIDTKVEATIPRVIVGYRIFDKEFDHKKFGRLHSYFYGGARFFNLGILAELPEPSLPLDLNHTWINPIVGLSLSYYLQRFTLTSEADIGLIESLSNPTWWVHLHARYRIHHRFSFALGWTVQNIHRETELLGHQFRYNVRLSGPMAGLTIHF